MGSKLKKEEGKRGGKSLWEFVDFQKIGRPVAFESPEQMWSLACEYFTWCQSNPIIRHRVMSSNGEVIDGYEEKKRAMTMAGLCVHMNIGVSTWYDYKNKADFSEVTTLIDRIMTEQKFTGAASGEFNANIIARDLGLADVQKVDSNQTVTAQVDLKADVSVKTALDDFKSEFMDE